MRALKVESEGGHVMTTGSRIIDKTQQLNNTSTSDCPQPTSFEKVEFTYLDVKTKDGKIVQILGSS